MKIRSRFVCPFLAAMLVVGCAHEEVVLQENPKKEIGQNVMEVALQSNFIESVQYPKTDVVELDQELLKRIQAYRKNFLNKISSYQGKTLPELNISYESYFKDHRYISIKLVILQTIEQQEEFVECLVYDTMHKKMVELFDIYDKTQLHLLAQSSEEYIKKNYPKLWNKEVLRTRLSLALENYENFLLTKDHFVLVFPQGKLFDFTLCIPIDYLALDGAMNLEKESINAYVPYPDILNEPVKNIDPQKPMVALTFDDGPTRKYTTRILDALKQHDAAATFFILGDRALNAPDLLQRMVLEGSEIGNHTFSHKQLTTLSKERIEEEINHTQETIYNITHTYPQIIRPPYGSHNEVVMQCAKNKRIVTWTIDSRDWEWKNTKKIVDHVMKEVRDGDIILLHDLYETSAEAAEILISQLSDRGYQLVSVSDLYRYRPQYS